MRISLDYYRILGVPIQATVDQLEQAYNNRVSQCLRPEYSEVAITARKALLDEAYRTLSHPEQRHLYDRALLAKTYESGGGTGNRARSADVLAHTLDDSEAHTLAIDIPADQLVGALVILLELGEYEQVVTLGQHRLRNVTDRLRSRYLGDTHSGIPDTVLSVALACLELGRERWQHQQYEQAAAALEIGQTLLTQENLFPAIQQNIQTELYNLRPYRVLELVALPEENKAEREHGLQLLRSMLNERKGIDGHGDDQSGLEMNDFLLFIQQLRTYLTAAEQQLLFEAESRRPSAVASYLAVYALIARGFAELQPALIRRAKVILQRLAVRQDVYLEMAICTMLLGQTEEATQALEESQDSSSLAFIREHSQGSPDLLPGLCLYTEYWLQEEVFPHFRDLAGRQASLKDYFADERVQIYLEELPADSDALPPPGGLDSTQLYAANSKSSSSLEPSAFTDNVGATLPLQPKVSSATTARDGYSSVVTASTLSSGAFTSRLESTWDDETSSSSLGKDSTPDQSRSYSPVGADRVSYHKTSIPASPPPVVDLPPSPVHSTQPSVPYATAPNGAASYANADVSSDLPITPTTTATSSTTVSDRPDVSISSDHAGESGHRLRSAVAAANAQSLRHPRSLRFRRSLFLLLGTALGVVIVWLLGSRVFQPLQATRQSVRSPIMPEQSSVAVPGNSPASATVKPSPSPLLGADPLTPESAKAVVSAWLAAKADAMGSSHNIDALAKVLAEPMLSQWQSQAEEAQANNVHGRFTHEVKSVSDLQISQDNPSQAIVTAEVREAVQFFQ
ncbi:MAG: IMS domain-containing protein, partial [Cyanobacteria bacterium]|nr:IMS domain-containing protein [Cyanobacteriota bacterium]MDW8201140.1 IMS domain-containing protein [Cyanobacteriota bacterium SKYGB_h_bin112]